MNKFEKVARIRKYISTRIEKQYGHACVKDTERFLDSVKGSVCGHLAVLMSMHNLMTDIPPYEVLYGEDEELLVILKDEDILKVLA